jgi:hypothetical protein
MNNLYNAIQTSAECNRGRGRYRNRNRNRERKRPIPFGHEKLDVEREKALLDRSVAMLTKLGQRGYALSEELGGYRVGQFDTDTDADTDADSGSE